MRLVCWGEGGLDPLVGYWATARKRMAPTYFTGPALDWATVGQLTV